MSTSNSKDSLNVILFGETGVGKSSVINLIAGKQVANVSPDVDGCTMDFKDYVIPVEGRVVNIWDTVGLEEPEMGVNGYLAAIEKAYALICKLSEVGGVDLLLFCIRGSRITATTQSNYRLFYEVLCNRQVPIALVVTNLERERDMEEWWVRNETYIKKYGMESVGHACVTGVPDEVDKYGISRTAMLKLLSGRDNKGRFSMPLESWLARVLAGLGRLLHNKNPPKGEKMVRTLIKRCNMEGETARRVATLLM
ncbi:P-loop containing nucleoside triphosphate hydrolase protein [Gyrodon lividus]|nr:P-loop containing nucleoside triphosphate hydrolase protein [Gyrodon lividus]